jgi:endonuclease YncB( thermonuclease family)
MANDLAASRFHRLVEDIGRLYVTARKAQVAFAWETGRRIVEEEQEGSIRAAYGAQLIPKLSEELSREYGSGFSNRTLADMRRFFLENKILRPAAKLTWTNHTLLMRVRDPRLRKSLERRAVKEGLGKYQLRRIVSEVNSDTMPSPAPVTPLKRPAGLKLNTYLKQPYGYLDLGFCVSYPAGKDDLRQVTVTDTPSYTYTATVERVVDGDTLLVVIELGFGVRVRDKLRLRGINCPELGTPEGEKAKAFVQKALPPGATIVLKSSKSAQDKYGRFVVDIFYLGKDSLPEEIVKDGTYLNQELLNKGLAVRM